MYIITRGSYERRRVEAASSRDKVVAEKRRGMMKMCIALDFGWYGSLFF
jgi:hypothetical protein